MKTREKIKYLTKRTVAECIKNPAIPVAIFGGIVVRLILILFNTFLLLWVISFVDSGYLKSEADAMMIYVKINIMGVCFAVVGFFILHKYIDRVPIKYSVTCSFMFRCIAMVGFLKIKKPDAAYTYLVLIMALVGSQFEYISVEAMFTK